MPASHQRSGEGRFLAGSLSVDHTFPTMCSAAAKWFGRALAGWVTLSLAGSALAAKRDTVALVITTKGDADASVIKAFVETFSESAGQVTSVQLLAGKALNQKVRTDAAVAAAACGADLKCLAKLGKKAKAARLIMARVIPAQSGTGVTVQALAVGTAS
jgi:hypothetical protein